MKNSRNHAGMMDNELVPSTSHASFNGDITSTSNNSAVLDERERRRAAYNIQSRIRDEQRKAEQGISTENAIENIFMQIEQNGEEEEDDNVGNLRTIKVESQTLKQMVELSTVHLDKMRDETAKSLDTDLFISRIKTYAARHRIPQENMCISLGKHYSKLMRCIPDFCYLRPTIELKKGPQLRERQARKGGKRERPETQEIRAKTLQQLQQDDPDKNSVSKELVNILKHFRAKCKQEASDEIDYYNFVLHPKSYSESIENMFYVAFLVKDGQFRLRIDPETGCPRIAKVSHAERDNRMWHRSEMDTTQVVTTINFSTWRRLVKKLDLKEPYIKRQAEDE